MSNNLIFQGSATALLEASPDCTVRLQSVYWLHSMVHMSLWSSFSALFKMHNPTRSCDCPLCDEGRSYVLSTLSPEPWSGVLKPRSRTERLQDSLSSQWTSPAVCVWNIREFSSKTSSYIYIFLLSWNRKEKKISTTIHTFPNAPSPDLIALAGFSGIWPGLASLSGSEYRKTVFACSTPSGRALRGDWDKSLRHSYTIKMTVCQHTVKQINRTAFHPVYGQVLHISLHVWLSVI